MTGVPEALDRNALNAHVFELGKRFDPELNVSDSYVEKWLDDIRGFSISSPEVQPVIKLSQDKNGASIDGIVAGLHERGLDGDARLASAIEQARSLIDGWGVQT
jgi:predicted FMN-binding regulatory protein PaiB